MNDFKLYLQEELVARCRKNPRYSLRSFAKAIGINHGVLSMILRDKRALTPEMVKRIGLSLKLEDQKLKSFLRDLSRSEDSNQGRKAQVKKMNQLTIDTFNIVSDWYHDAILELSRVRGFKPTAEFISKRLGISVSEARAAVDRLKRVGLIEITPDGKWLEPMGDTTTTSDVDFTSVALRNLQKQVLERSAHALENVPKSMRDHACTTMAIRLSDLKEAKLKIKKFRQELMSFLQHDGNDFEEVYQLAVSFYPLTKITNIKGS